MSSSAELEPARGGVALREHRRHRNLTQKVEQLYERRRSAIVQAAGAGIPPSTIARELGSSDKVVQEAIRGGRYGAAEEGGNN